MIELVNLTKIYHSETEGSLGLKSISVKFPETGLVAITGESGSGKTTLLNVLSGFKTYEEGSLFIDGVDFMSFSQEDIETYRKNDIGFVFQDYHLIENHTVLDNLIEALLIIGVAPKAAKKKSLETLEKFGLLDHKKSKARELSSGQKQKLSIARALIKEPKIVLCDEPTANLDTESGKQVFAIFQEYAKDHLVILSTHNYEDAKDYVTHFMRLYKGELTSFEQVKETAPKAIEPKKSGATDFFKLSLTSFKSQKTFNIFKMILSSLLVFLSLFMLAMFNANIDDSFTKIVNRSVFNNVTQNEMLVMKKDGSYISQNEMNKIRDLDHVTGTQLYGLATEMNYYYRENIDYGYAIEIVKKDDVLTGVVTESTEKVFKTLREDMYIKSFDGVITESDLASGTLPVNHYDIVVYGNYNLGDNVKIFFHDPVLQGYSYFEFNFTVVGLLKEPHEDAYFSNSFIKSIDYIQANSKSSPAQLIVCYQEKSRFSSKEHTSYTYYNFEPLLDTTIGKDEIRFSKTFETAAAESFPEDDKINYIRIMVPEHGSESIPVTISTVPADEKLPAFCVYVGEDIYHYYIDLYQTKTSRIIFDNYANIDSVISGLTNQKYDCLSEYRSASNAIDLDKRDQRATTLITALCSLFAAIIVYYVFNFLLEKNRLSADRTLFLLGASKKNIYQSSIIQICAIHLFSVIIGFALYLISTLLPIPYLQSINLYLRFFQFAIVFGVVLILDLLLVLKYRRDFLNMNKKGGQ